MQQTALTKPEPLTLESLEKRISTFFNDSHILKQQQLLLPKEEQCCERVTD